MLKMVIMKKIATCFILLCFFINHSMAQKSQLENLKPAKKWQVNQFNFGLGFNWDRYESMSLNQLMVLAEDPEKMHRDLHNMQEEAITYALGAGLYYSVSLSPFNRSKGTYNDRQELRLGFALHSPKEAMVSYKNEIMDTSIVYCNIHGEFSLEGAYLFKGNLGPKLRWYIGGGINGGLTFGNEMIIISGKYFKPGQHPTTQESLNQEKYKAKPIYYSRAYIPYGLHYIINESISVGFDLRTGMGIQLIQGEKVNRIRRTGAFVLGLQYHFRKFQ